MGLKVEGQVHHKTIYGQNYSFGSITPFKCTIWQLSSSEKTCRGNVEYFWKIVVQEKGHHMTLYGTKKYSSVQNSIQIKNFS